MKHLPPTKVLGATLQLWRRKSLSEVAQSLKIFISSVQRIRNENVAIISAPHPGRPRGISTKTRSVMAHHYDIGYLKTYKDEQRFAQSAEGYRIHINTVRWNLLQKASGHTHDSKALSESISECSKAGIRQDHIHWTMNDWKKVMSSDETMISRFGSLGKSYCHSRRGRRRFLPHQVLPTLQGEGRKMMVWGCITFFFWLRWCKLAAGQDRFKCLPRCCQGLCPAVARLVPHEQGDIHLSTRQCSHAHCTQDCGVFWAGKNRCSSLACQLSQLNPIDHVWACIKRSQYRYLVAPEDMDELWERAQVTWEHIPNDLLQNCMRAC